MYPRFQVRFAIVLTALILISVVTVSILQQRGQGLFLEDMHASTTAAMEEALLEQMQKKGQNTAQLIAAILANPLYLGQLSVIREIASAVRNRPDVALIYVLDKDLKIVHDGTKEIKSYGQRMADPLIRNAVRLRAIKSKIDGDKLDVAAPIVIGSQVIGVARICILITEIKSDIAQLRKSLVEVKKRTQQDILFIALAVMGVLALVGVIFSVIIARWLSRPIEEFFRKRNEELERSNASLQEEIAERRRVEGALRRSERRSRDFAADAAHELRTPLAVLRTQLDNLEDEKIAAALRHDVEEMSRMVEQLLAATRLDFLVLGPDDRADLSRVCRRVAEHIAPYALSRGRSIELVGADRPVLVNGNTDALEQAVRNLVENAIRNSRAGTTVTVVVAPEPSVQVIDQGEGIPIAWRDDVFRRFWRADSRGGGAGLGLSIVRRTVEIHNGTVDIEDNPQGGAIFTIHLPRAA